MPDGVHPAVQDMQPTLAKAVTDCVCAEAEVHDLPASDDSVLTFR